ncbi:hypothetical protein AAX05_03360 [Moraxella bovoculi]|uniref:tail completion protein gp17 n=1 Tax=Moraxella bovoculi TaxID=386891 RepID=UPI000624A7F7|nr:DUF3168 domain-containing protein [Moraxella bovoculi]AKG09371.1 hypothetical protein AAX05_03360 [Moraxella bovoculi]AKG13197.1 hypothetical protein AAX11_03110 [Moraxella bovoculi]
MDSYALMYPILSTLVDKRAYVDYVPEQPTGKLIAPPYIVYREIDAIADNVLDEFLGVEYVRVQVDVYHKTHLECRKLSNQVIAVMLSSIKYCEFISRQRLYDPDTKFARYSMDFQFSTTVA